MVFGVLSLTGKRDKYKEEEKPELTPLYLSSSKSELLEPRFRVYFGKHHELSPILLLFKGKSYGQYGSL